MSIEVKDKIGTASVTVHYNAMTQEPEVAVDLDVTSEVFPVTTCLGALLSATRRMAEEIEKKIAELEQPPVAPTPISDKEY